MDSKYAPPHFSICFPVFGQTVSQFLRLLHIIHISNIEQLIDKTISAWTKAMHLCMMCADFGSKLTKKNILGGGFLALLEGFLSSIHDDDERTY